MRRFFIALLAALIGLSIWTGTASAKWHPTGRWIGPCSGWLYGENLTSKKWHSPGGAERGRRQMRRLIACEFRRAGMASQIPHALYVAERESHFFPFAHSTSGCLGMWQHMGRYWGGRARAYLVAWHFPHDGLRVSAMDPRAATEVTVAMVKRGGWQPWGG